MPFTGCLPTPNYPAPTPTSTPIQPTSTRTPVRATSTPTNTAIPPTATATSTPVPPTATSTATPPVGTCSTPFVRTGWTATSSDVYSNNVPANVLDGNSSTVWTTGQNQVAGMYFTIDMGQLKTFN